MKFYLPTKVYEEVGCVRNHAAELASFGRRALIVTGRRSADLNGSFADVAAALEGEGCSWVRFSEIEENPSVETILKARDFGLQEQADFVIGIGGGSPMDAAKAIALMIYNRDKDASFLYESGNPVTALPVVAVPTTCGTGSEVTGVSVLTRHDKKTKGSIPYALFPQLALADPTYLKAAPSSVLRCTGCDALAHLCESYINSKATDYSRMLADAGLRVWSRNLPVLLTEREPTDEDYTNLLCASTMAGMAIAQTGTAVPHALSYGLTYDLGVAHGRACGRFLGGYLVEAPKEMSSHVLELSGLGNLDAYYEYYDRSCSRPELSDEEAERVVERVIANPAKWKTAPFEVNEAVLRKIVNS